MGQRLNIEIIENGKTLANSYYHWAAYTSSSLELAQEILNKIDSISYKDRVVNAVKLLEVTGSGLTESELTYAKNHIKDFDKYEFKECEDRNQGLLAISEDGIQTIRHWEEKRVDIDLTNKVVDFKVARIYKTVKEYEQDYDKKCDYPIQDINLEKIPFSKFSKICEIIYKLVDEEIYGVKTSDGKVISFIE